MSHLTFEARKAIADMLDGGSSLNEISRALKRPRSTVVREIRRSGMELDTGAKGRPANRCALREGCRHSHVCGDGACVRGSCGRCGKCNAVCPDYREQKCARLEAPPYVCNGCRDRGGCVLRKRACVADVAQRRYEDTLRGVRSGTRLDESELSSMDSLLREGLSMGQSVHHMMASSPDAFPVSGKTVYRLVGKGLFPRVRRVDLPEAVRRRPRGKGCVERPAGGRRDDGRGHQDYKLFMDAHPELSAVEIDSVVGRVGGKCLLTLNFTECGMLPAFLRERNDAASVVECLDRLEEAVGPEAFRRLFRVALTDNGSEFAQAGRMEADEAGNRRIGRLFFCDPYSSWQKGHVENNHLNLRRILPKGRSMDDLTQEKVNLAVSHVNSMLRAKYGDVPAIEAFRRIVGDEALRRLGIWPVPAAAVNLTPALVGWK